MGPVMIDMRSLFFFGNDRKCFLLALLLAQPRVTAPPFYGCNLTFSWKLRIESCAPAILARDILIADDELDARREFLAQFWVDELNALPKRRSKRDIQNLVVRFERHYGLGRPPKGIILHAIPYPATVVEEQWKTLLVRFDQLRGLRINRQAPRLPNPPN